MDAQTVVVLLIAVGALLYLARHFYAAAGGFRAKGKSGDSACGGTSCGCGGAEKTPASTRRAEGEF